MMRNLLYTFVLLLAANFATAQVEISPNELAFVAEDGADQIYIEFDVINNNDNPVDLYWKLDLADNFPSEWTAQLCDKILCYGFDTYQSSPSAPNDFAAGESYKFSLKVRRTDFGVMEGSSFGILRLFDDPEFTNEVATSQTPTVSTTNVNLSDIVLFPNPTTDAFQIKSDEDVATVSIFNIVGREVSRLSHHKGMIHDVSSLRTGMYLVRLENKEGEVVKAMRLSKR